MDTNDVKKSPMKKFIDNINSKKNIFITRIKILKQLKKNGNDVNIETIQKVFNINITKTKEKKSEKTNNIDFLNQSNENINNRQKKENVKKIKDIEMINNTKKKLTFCFFILLICGFNILASITIFDLNNNIKFNTINEQFIETISRSIKSPQTDVYLKSKFDKNKNSIIYYYEIIDNLDSYTYKIKNTDVDNELRVKLLENIATKSKEIKNIEAIKTTDYNTITLVGDSYIINNTYKINEKNISGKDINIITSSIKNNNIKYYNDRKIEFTVASFLTFTIIESFLYFIIKKQNKNKKDAL